MPTTASSTSAREQARRMLDLMPPDRYDAIITNAGGCGSHLRHYASLLGRRSALSRRARRVWDAQVARHSRVAGRDRLPRADGGAVRRAHRRDVPRLLSPGARAEDLGPAARAARLLPGVSLVELPESSWCCGSAGVYALTQPAQADALLQRKVGHIASTGATTLVTANPGCQLQIARGLREAGRDAQSSILCPCSPAPTGGRRGRAVD